MISGSFAAAAQEEYAEDSAFVEARTCPTDVLEQCGLLAARGEVEELRPLYDRFVESMPEHTALYCRFAFARAEHDYKRVVEIVDTLETRYADNLDLRGLLALCDVRLEAHRALGEYAALRRYCRERLDWCYRRGIKQSRQKNMKFYQQLAQRFAESPAPTEIWGERKFTLPVSRDWPVMMPASINGRADIPFYFDPTQPYTIISEADAKESGVTSVGEVMQLATARGVVNVRPAITGSMVIGQLRMENLMVFVADNDLPAPYNRTLGRDVIERMHNVRITDECITISVEGAAILADRSSRAKADYRPMRVDDYVESGDVFGLLRNETSLVFTATAEEQERMDGVLDRCCSPIAAEDVPSWLTPYIRPASSATMVPHTLMNTPKGLAYERLEDDCYKTIIINDKNIKGCAVDLQNMIIYVP